MDRKLWVNGRLAAEDIPAAIGKAYWGNSHGRLLQQYYDEGKFFTLSDADNTMKAIFSMYEDAFPHGAEGA